MPIDNNRLFIVSGIASFFLFSLVILVIVWQARILVKPLSFASLQSDVISISLDSSVVVVVVDSKPQEQASEVPMPIQPPEIEKNTKVNEEKKAQPEITDLFSTIKATRSLKESKSRTKELSELSALEEKVLSTKRSSQLFEKVKSLDLAKAGVKVVATSSGPLVNEYYAKVQGIIYSNFHPASGTEGFSARVRIVLTSDGKLASYHIISSSGSAVFNAEVDWLRERLRQVALPQNPTGDEAVFEIILTAKD